VQGEVGERSEPGGVVTSLGDSQTLQPLSLVITRQLPLHRGAFFQRKPSGSGNRSGSPSDNILSKATVSGLAGGGDPALESRVRVLSYISYKKYRRKMANGLPTAPSPELSVETSVTIPPSFASQNPPPFAQGRLWGGQSPTQRRSDVCRRHREKPPFQAAFSVFRYTQSIFFR